MPLIFAGPGVPRGLRVDKAVSGVDPARPKRAVVRGQWKLVLDPRNSGRELHDLDAGPLERVNRAAAEPEQTSLLANDLSQLQALGYVRG